MIIALTINKTFFKLVLICKGDKGKIPQNAKFNHGQFFKLLGQQQKNFLIN